MGSQENVLNSEVRIAAFAAISTGASSIYTGAAEIHVDRPDLRLNARHSHDDALGVDMMRVIGTGEGGTGYRYPDGNGSWSFLYKQGYAFRLFADAIKKQFIEKGVFRGMGTLVSSPAPGS